MLACTVDGGELFTNRRFSGAAADVREIFRKIRRHRRARDERFSPAENRRVRTAELRVLHTAEVGMYRYATDNRRRTDNYSNSLAKRNRPRLRR